MLRGVFVIHHSGLLLFHKNFFTGVESTSGILAGVIIAMMDFARAKTGLPVRYIELKNMAVCVVEAPELVTCAVFMDVEDGPDFAKLIAGELLATFLSQYQLKLAQGQISDRDAFLDFTSEIVGVIRNAVLPVLGHLRRQEGVNTALLVSGDQVLQLQQDLHSTDSLDVLATHQALLGKAINIMAGQGDQPTVITVRGDSATVYIQRIERSSFMVVYAHNASPDRIRREIGGAAQLLGKVLVAASNLKDAVSLWL